MQVAKMDTAQLRDWAEFMDKATIIALVVAVLAIVAAGATTWLSFKYHRTIGLRSTAETTGELASLQKEAAAANERSTELEKANAEANSRVVAADKRAGDLEKAVEAAKARAADLEKQLAEAKARAHAEESQPAAPPAGASAPETDGQYRPLVEQLKKFAGTKAAIYAVSDAADAADLGAAINAALGKAGWASAVWQWTGVGGMMGVAVLTREGADPAIDQAAAAAVDALRAAGFNAAKAGWPADSDWHRLRGSFSGPPSPDPTDAPIRIVIGSRSR